jgi:hypothetical protein
VGVNAEELKPEPITPLEITKDKDSLFTVNCISDTIKIGNLDAAKSGAIDFKPNVLFSGFGGQYLFSLDLVTDDLGIDNSKLETALTALIDSRNNSVKATSPSIDIEYKPTDVNKDFNEYGGLDMFITIKDLLKSNILTFNYDAARLIPYLQPPLTDEYKDGWSDEFQCEIKVTETQVTGMPKGSKDPVVLVERPDYVVNSLAIYASDAGGMVTTAQESVHLTTGKIGHLYRMQVVDAKGNKSWVDWTILNPSQVGLRLDDKFMSIATYPIVIQPVGDTFGYTVAGASTSTIEDAVKATTLTCPYAGTGVSVTAFLSGTGTTQKYKYNVGTLSGNTMTWITNGKTGESTYNGANNKSPYPKTFTSAPTLAAQNYYFAAWGSSGSGSITECFDTSTEIPQEISATYASSWPTNFTGGSGENITYSIYCTYTPGGGTPDMTNSPASKAFGVVAANSTNYAKGSAPVDPNNVADSDCTFTITNTSSAAENISVTGSNFTGGVGWTLAGSVGENNVKIVAYYSGEAVASGKTLTTSPQAFISSLAASATKLWDFAFYTGTFTDGDAKTGTITLTASAAKFPMWFIVWLIGSIIMTKYKKRSTLAICSN